MRSIATQPMRPTLAKFDPLTLRRGPSAPPISTIEGAFESPYIALSFGLFRFSIGSAGGERGGPQNSMFCAIQNLSPPRALRGDARQRTDAPHGAPTPEPLGLKPGDFGGPRGPAARGRRERAGARGGASRDKKKHCAQSTICVTTTGRVQARSRVDSADPRREWSARWHSRSAPPRRRACPL